MVKIERSRSVSRCATELGVHTCTVEEWYAAGLLTGQKANDKNEQLYRPLNGIDVQAVIRQRRRRSNRQDTQSTPGGAV